MYLILISSHCDQEAKLLQDNPGRDAHAEQQSSGKPRPCSLLFHNILEGGKSKEYFPR